MKLFPSDALPKRKRAEYTLNHQPVDRAAIMEQVSYNPHVIAMYTGKKIEGFNYTADDICEVIVSVLRTTPLAFPRCRGFSRCRGGIV